jgi:DNA polymerase III delta subunit
MNDMAIPQCVLLTGEVYRCELELAARDAEIVAAHPDTERHLLFGDEIEIRLLNDELRSGSLFTLCRHFVIRHLEYLKKSEKRALANLIKSTPPPDTFITLVAQDRLRPSPLSKTMQKHGAIKHFQKPKGKTFRHAAIALLKEQGLELPPGEVEQFLAKAGGELLRVLNEVRKLLLFSPDGQPSPQAIIRLSFTGGEGSIYPLLDRIMEGNLQAAFKAFQGLHTDPGRIFYSLIHQLTRLLMVRILLDTGTPSAKIASTIGASSWLTKRLSTQANAHSAGELTATLDYGIELDARIKSGKIRPRDAVLALILSVTNPLVSAPGHTHRNLPAREAAC